MVNNIYTTQNRTSGSLFNSGPACVSMALKYQRNNMHTVEEIKDDSQIFWDVNAICNKLKQYEVNYTIITNGNIMSNYATALKHAIFIVSVNMAHLPRGHLINKPYTTLYPWRPHHLVLTKCCANQTFSVLDPLYENNRIYDIPDMLSALLRFGSNIIEISE